MPGSNAQSWTITAGADLTANQAVIAAGTVSANGNAIVVGTVLQDCKNGEPCAIQLLSGGVAKGIASAAIAAGAAVEPAASGQWATRGAGTGTRCVALTAAAGAGSIFELTSLSI